MFSDLLRVGERFGAIVRRIFGLTVDVRLCFVVPDDQVLVAAVPAGSLAKSRVFIINHEVHAVPYTEMKNVN